MLKGPIDGTVAIAADLKKAGVPMVGLTNWSADTFPIAERRFEFLQWFEGVIVSGREGVKKPDAAIFRLVQERFGLEPDSTIFVDDSPRNVEAAAALGFQAHHFTEPEGLRQELESAGLLSR